MSEQPRAAPGGSSPNPSSSRQLRSHTAANNRATASNNMDEDLMSQGDSPEEIKLKRLKALADAIRHRKITEDLNTLHRNQASRRRFANNPDLHRLLPIRHTNDEGVVTFESNRIQVTIRRVHFQRQRKFALSDLLFHIKFKPLDKPNEAPYLVHLNLEIERAVEEILRLIRIEIDEDLYSVVYFLFEDGGFTNGAINTPSYELALSDKEIAEKAIAVLSSVLRSYLQLRVNDTFRVTVKVLSAEHDQVRKKRKPFSYNVGAKGEEQAFIPEYLLPSPSTYNIMRFDDYIEFENKCLLASLLFAYLQNCHHRHEYDTTQMIYENRDYLDIRYLRYKGAKGKLARQKLLQKINNYITVFELPEDGPFDLEVVMEKFMTAWGVQINIYSNLGLFRYKQYPPIKDLSRPQIYLYEETFVNQEIRHMSALLNPATFFKKSVFYCPYCHKILRRSYAHHCRWPGKPSKSCFICRRINFFVESNYYITSANEQDFCFRPPLCDEIDIYCQTCQMTAVTEECFIAHKGSTSLKLCIGHGYKCTICDKFVYNSNFLTKDDLKQKHVCYEEQCRICQEKYMTNTPQTHMCQLKQIKKQSYFPNHAFFDIETSINKCVSECAKCYMLENSYMESLPEGKKITRKGIQDLLIKSQLDYNIVRCSKHLNTIWSEGIHTATYVVLAFEDGKRGNFSYIHFADPNMNHPNDLKIFRNKFQYNYWPDEYSENNLTKKTRKSGHSGHGLSSTPINIEKANKYFNTLSSNPSKYNKRRKVDSADIEEELDDISDGEEDLDLPVHIYQPSIQASVHFSSKFNMEDFKHLEPLTKMLIFLIKNSMYNYSIMSHNGSKFDMVLLCQAIYDQGLTPNVLMKANQIIQLQIPALRVTFLDSLKYIPTSLSSLAKTYKLTEKKGFFPHVLNTDSYYEYDGYIPQLNHFLSFNDDESTINAKVNYVEEAERDNYRWNFKKEISEYCVSDVEILAKGCLIFLKEALQFQVILNRKYVPETTGRELTLHDILNPFGPPFCSISSYIFGCYRKFVLPKYTIYALNSEVKTCNVNTSMGEQEFVSYFNYKYEGEEMLSVYTSEKCMSFDKIIPDFYVPSKHIIGFYHGCIYHGCLSSNCTSIKDAKPETTNYLGHTFQFLNNKFDKQIQKLKENFGFNDTQIIIIWECEWDIFKNGILENMSLEDRKRSLDIRNFLSNIFEKKPSRLIPRDALRGGKVEAINMLYSQETSPNEEMHYEDKTSLYPSITMKQEFQFPVDKPYNLVRKEDLDQLYFDDNKCYYKLQHLREQVRGVIKLKILAPKLFVPFLPYRVTQRGKGTKSICACCRVCTELFLTDPCNHTEDERAFTDTWVIDEIAYAVSSLNYKVMVIYEALIWTQHADIFSSFCKLLGSYKIRNSGFPLNVTSEEDRRRYCDTINETMGFISEDVYLTPNIIADSPTMRFFFKLCSNALLGKLGQKDDKSQTIAVDNQEAVNTIVRNGEYDITDYILVNADILQLTLKKKVKNQRPCLTNHVVLAAHVTAWSRIDMDRDIRKIEAVNGVLYYMDTDSLIYTLKKGEPSPLKMGHSYGDYKNEIEGSEMTRFASLGCKNYAYTTKSRDGIEEECTKVRGFFIKDPAGKAKINMQTFRQYINAFLENTYQCKPLGQFQIRTSRENLQLYNLISVKYFSNFALDKRVALKERDVKCFTTLPYGYNEEMLYNYVLKPFEESCDID